MTLGAVTHTMVKGLSRGKSSVVNFYSGNLYQGDLRYTWIYLPRLISVFTQLLLAAGLAQSVECLTAAREVGGSILRAGAILRDLNPGVATP